MSNGKIYWRLILSIARTEFCWVPQEAIFVALSYPETKKAFQANNTQINLWNFMALKGH